MKSLTNRATALLLSLLLLLSSMPVLVLSAAWDGETKSEPALSEGIYQITEPDELAWLAAQVNAGNSTLNAVLAGDVDLGSRSWTPIGGYDTAYTGTFDGGGHRITGLYIESAAAYQGLFGYVGKDGVIRDLRVEGGVTSNRTFLGGIAGRSDGTLTRCESAVTVKNTSTSAGNSQYIGGVAGQSTGLLLNCRNTGEVTGMKAGGVVGYLGGTAAGCVNEGRVQSTVDSEGQTANGGIAGVCDGIVYNCANLGDISSSCKNGYGSFYLGGIIGQASKNAQYIFNCYQTGAITARVACSNMGPIYGNLNKQTADNNYYLAEVANPAAGAVTKADLQSADFAEKLNQNSGDAYGLSIPEGTAFTAVADGYPLPQWLASGSAPAEVSVTAAAIAGKPKAGETLTASAVGAEGTAATGVSYQWQVAADDGAFSDIDGADSAAFVIPDDLSYVGKRLRVRASGAADSSAVSPATAAIDRSDAQKVAEALESLTIEADAALTEELTLPLPSNGLYDTAVVWSSSQPDVIAADGTVRLPESGIASVTLTADISFETASDKKTFSFSVYSAAAVSDQEYVDAAKQALSDSWYKLSPVFGTDRNAVTMLTAALAERGFADLTVSIVEHDNRYIAANGDITYYYADPNSFQAMWFASTPVTFRLTRHTAAADYRLNAVIHWEADLARETLRTEIADKVDEDAMRGDNPSLSEVRGDLVLPKVVDGKKWSLISWESSNDHVIAVDDSNQSTADTLFDPYIGKIRRGLKDQTVTLTATFHFQLTSSDEAAITLQKTYTVVVKGLDGTELQALMQAELDTHYTADKLLDFSSRESIDPAAVAGDIQLPIPRNTGVADYQSYTFSVAADNEAAVVSGYRANIYRPLPGETAKPVTLTITMAHKDYDISVQKTLSLTVQPLEQAEIDAELALMAAVKAAYFDGINNGANPDAAHITANLSAFQEAVSDGSGGVSFRYRQADLTGTGIVPVSIDLTHPSEAWDRFHSSSPTVISHENLLVTQPTYHQTVIITSCLSSETFEKYAARYPDNAAFAALVRQPVSATLTVLGEKGEGGGETAAVTGSFTLVGDTAHGASGHVSYPVWMDSAAFSAEKGATVMDVFRELLTQNGYTFSGGSFVSSITSPGGCTLASGTNGANSGWMYAVNGKLGQVMADTYILEDGDAILWFYTDNYAGDNRVDGGDIVIDSDVPLPDYTAEWDRFRGNSGGSAVVNTKTPLDAARQQWAFALKGADEWTKSVSDPIMINGNLYVAVGSELLIISPTGERIQTGALAAPIDYTCRPLYTGGKILVPLSGGRLQALAADSLKTVWLTEALPEHEELAHQSLSTVTETDGYVYFGTACADWTTSYYGIYLCVEAATGQVVWQYENTDGGYYWSGAALLNGALIVAGDDGVLTALDAHTGERLDSLPLGAPVRSTVVTAGDSILVVSTDGRLHKVSVGANGRFGAHASVAFAAGSTCTPAFYNGKAYVGGAAADYTGVFCVINLSDMTVEQTAAVPADVKSAPLLSTGNTGGATAYFTANAQPGGIYVLKPGAKEAVLLFTPEAADQNYCMASILAGPDGVLYYTNDSGKLFAVAPVSGSDTTSSEQTATSSADTTTSAADTTVPTAGTTPTSGHSAGSETTGAGTVLPTAPPETTVPADPATGETEGIAVWLLLAAGTGAAVLLLIGRRGRPAECR